MFSSFPPKRLSVFLPFDGDGGNPDSRCRFLGVFSVFLSLPILRYSRPVLAHLEDLDVEVLLVSSSAGSYFTM